MKRYAFPLALALFLFATAIPSQGAAEESVPADSNSFSDSTILNKLPLLKDEDLKQVLFAGKVDFNTCPHFVEFELHNPFRDRVLRGIVVTVTVKNGADGDPVSSDLFIRVAAPPLKMEKNSEQVYSGMIVRGEATVKLKEVHYAAVKE